MPCKAARRWPCCKGEESRLLVRLYGVHQRYSYIIAVTFTPNTFTQSTAHWITLLKLLRVVIYSTPGIKDVNIGMNYERVYLYLYSSVHALLSVICIINTVMTFDMLACNFDFYE